MILSCGIFGYAINECKYKKTTKKHKKKVGNVISNMDKKKSVVRRELRVVNRYF